MITVRYSITGTAEQRVRTFDQVSEAALCVRTVLKSQTLELINIMAKPRVLAAVALASVA